MRLALRCDASLSTGVGHVMRCVSLAESGRALGHEVVLVGSVATVPWVTELLATRGLPVLEPPPWQGLAAWATGEGFDAVHVDAYDAPGGLHAECRDAGLLLSNVEDGSWGRKPADVVVDSSLGAPDVRRPDDGSSQVLLGPRYTLLRAAVRRGRVRVARRRAEAAAVRLDLLDVVVVLGGTDAKGLLPSMLGLLAAAQQAAGVPTLRVLAATPAGAGRCRIPTGLDVTARPVGAELVDEMAKADVVVTAAGTTLGELCCLGLPMAVVPVVDNQLTNYRQVVRRGCAVGLAGDEQPGLGPDAAAALAGLLRSPEVRAALSSSAAALVDGAGSARVIRALERSVGAGPVPLPPLAARPACRSDALLLLDWRNDEVVRAVSRNSEVVAEAEHLAWVEAVLTSPRRHLLLVEDAAAQSVGSIRWDALPGADQAWEVSVMLAPHHRGRGWGAAVLAVGERALVDLEEGARTLIAMVHSNNPASLRMFGQAGYRATGEPDGAGFLRLEKRLR